VPVHTHIHLLCLSRNIRRGLLALPDDESVGLCALSVLDFIVATPFARVGLILRLSGGLEPPTILSSMGLLVCAELFCVMIWRARAAERAKARDHSSMMHTA
jgi:hypothetical protein